MVVRQLTILKHLFFFLSDATCTVTECWLIFISAHILVTPYIYGGNTIFVGVDSSYPTIKAQNEVHLQKIYVILSSSSLIIELLMVIQHINRYCVVFGNISFSREKITTCISWRRVFIWIQRQIWDNPTRVEEKEMSQRRIQTENQGIPE